MANVQIKSEERRQQEAAVLRSYGVSGRGTRSREKLPPSLWREARKL